MERKIYGIFVAGGQGTRMGSSMPKQFLLLDGLPVLQRSIQRFVDACPDIKIITVLPREHFSLWNSLCLEHHLDCPQKLVEGGITRFHSVKNALEHVPDGAIVSVHDGVRPLVSESLIRNMLLQMETCGALIPVLPATDTLKALEPSADGSLVHCAGPDPDRSRVYCAQTPQMFRSELIKDAYRQGFDTAFTDDASVLAKRKTPLSYTIGERLNIKITTPEDLVLAKAILSSFPF